MTTRRCGGSFHAVLVGTLLCTSGGLLSVSHAQVTSSGLGTAVDQPVAGTYNITGGTRPAAGTNLFHSFGNFSLNVAESANFLNNSGLATSNILARVTAGNPSNIFGIINTLDFGGANLFLMNPAGIIFGPTARLDVGGSFHATTADYIKLGNDGIFFADPAQATVLTTSPPSAFGFLSANPKPIEVQTGGFAFDDVTFELLVTTLKVPEGQTLSLVGGNAAGSQDPGVSIGALDGSAPGYVLAPAGRVNLVSVASAGEATFDGVGFNVDGFAKLGGIKVGPGSIVDGKEIFIQGGRLAIHDGVVMPSAFAFEQTFAVDAVTRLPLTALPNGGQVNIKVTDDVTITGSPFTFEPLTAKASGIYVYSGDPFFISDAAKLPDVRIDAGSVSISGFAIIQAQRNAPGETGSVVINANKVSVGSGGSIVLTNSHAGDGPSLTITAKEVDVAGDGSPSVFGVEGLFVQGLTHIVYPSVFTDSEFITADSGNISINATDSLAVRGLGQVTTDSLNFGKAGDITINAGNVLVAGTGDPQSALIGSQSNFAGDSGNIKIDATGSITVKDGGRITSSSFGAGNAGNVSLTASGPITLSGQDARIVGATFQPPDSQLNALFSTVFGGEPVFDSDGNFVGFITHDFDFFRNQMGNPNATLMQVLAHLQDIGLVGIPGEFTPGNAGAVSVTTPALTLNAGTRIETSTGWEGNAGSVVGNVGTLSVLDGGAIRSRSGVEFLDGTARVGMGDPCVSGGGCQGGSVNITASDTITISGQGSTISTSTFGDGAGGNVELNAGNRVAILNGGRVSADSGGMLGGSFVSGTGLAGNITITSGNEIYLNNGQITTQALTADGGNITLMAPNVVQLQDSVISTSVSGGAGQGGNILIDPQFVILNNSSIIANAFGGPGGNITIIADNFVSSATSVVEASSALSTPGVIQIVSPDNNVENSIAQLTAAFIDASGLLRGLCSARHTGAPSSFVVAGRGGVPVEADGYRPSFGTDVTAGLASTDGPVRAEAGPRLDGSALMFALMMNDPYCLR